MSSAANRSATAARPLNRWGVGFFSIVQFILLTLCVVAVNYLAALYPLRFDLSRGADFSLSRATTRYLASDALSSRAEPVKWIMAFHRTHPLHGRIRAMAEEYERLSKGRIQLEVVDVMASPDRAAQVIAAYGISLADDMILIDARTAEDGEAVITNERLGIRELNNHVKIVVADDLLLYETDPQGQRRARGFRGEDVLTANLTQALEGRPRNMLFLADKSRIEARGEESPWHTLDDVLRMRNITLKAANLSGMGEVPQDADAVALVAPQYDLTDEELSVLERYWNRPRAAMLVLLEPGVPLPKLRAFLRAHGVTPRNDRIIARRGETLDTAAKGTFSYNIDFLSDLAGQTSEFGGASGSLEVREGAGDLESRRIHPWALFQISEGFWGESKFGDGKEAFDPVEDHGAPLFLAASVLQGDLNTPRGADEAARMIVVSNTAFLKPENRVPQNMDFLASSVNWMVGRESLAGVGPRSLGLYRLPLLDPQISFINRVNLIFMPALFALIGVMVWSARRS